MFELVTYKCPNCNGEIHEPMKDDERIECFYCKSSYTVMFDGNTKKTAFIPIDEKVLPEPLYLPRGSIRAVSTLIVAITCWILIFKGTDVPNYLLGLLLTVIGYYFGFRKKLKTAQSKIFDASAKKIEPLFLPPGFIRFLLITGFAVSAVVLYVRFGLLKEKYLEFFVILLGLILGYLFAKATSKMQNSIVLNLINHLKGLIVLSASVYLAWLLLTGQRLSCPYIALTMACLISFYFGSRS
jgi:DNA-directed RNA polymerase subunit RPC12/RpoP/uncharacterized membrane protein YfcA